MVIRTGAEEQFGNRIDNNVLHGRVRLLDLKQQVGDTRRNLLVTVTKLVDTKT